MLFSPARVMVTALDTGRTFTPAGSRPTCWPSRSAMGPPDLLVLGGRPEGWHGARLREALAAWALDRRAARLPSLGIAVGGGTGVRISGAGRRCPPRSWSASIPAGSFER